jgi:hypothetical protein
MDEGTIEHCIRQPRFGEKPKTPSWRMNQSQSVKVRAAKRWLSQLLAYSACPVIALALAISQVKIGHHSEGTLRQGDQQSSQLQLRGAYPKPVGIMASVTRRKAPYRPEPESASANNR